MSSHGSAMPGPASTPRPHDAVFEYVRSWCGKNKQTQVLLWLREVEDCSKVRGGRESGLIQGLHEIIQLIFVARSARVHRSLRAISTREDLLELALDISKILFDGVYGPWRKPQRTDPFLWKEIQLAAEELRDLVESEFRLNPRDLLVCPPGDFDSSKHEFAHEARSRAGGGGQKVLPRTFRVSDGRAVVRKYEPGLVGE